jgi:hypothetical protein
MGATVELVAPDISGYYGNTGVPFVTTLDSGKPGPDAMGASPEHRPHAHCARWQVPRCSLGRQIVGVACPVSLGQFCASFHGVRGAAGGKKHAVASLKSIPPFAVCLLP